MYVKSLITDWWWNSLLTEAERKSSLKWLMVDGYKLQKPHEVWSSCKGKTDMVEAATWRAKMLSGRYVLQSNHAKYNQNPVNPACLLCKHHTEDMEHFLRDCEVLEEARRAKMEDLKDTYKKQGVVPPSNKAEWCSALLNGGQYWSSDCVVKGSSNRLQSQLCRSHLQSSACGTR